MFCVYYGRTKASGTKMVVFIDLMRINTDGKIVVMGPTTTPQPKPLTK